MNKILPGIIFICDDRKIGLPFGFRSEFIIYKTTRIDPTKPGFNDYYFRQELNSAIRTDKALDIIYYTISNPIESEYSYHYHQVLFYEEREHINIVLDEININCLHGL